MPYADPEDGRERSRESRREATRAKQDIASQLGKVKNPRRRKKAEKSYEFFARTYFPERFDKPFSEDHLKTIALIEEAVLRGGKLAVAMPRGSGKTTLIEVACIWALLIGARNFVVLIGSDKDAALEMLESIKSELESNDLLAEDFPLEVGPFALLEGEARRCNGQRYGSDRTYVQWKADRVVFATIKGSKASGGLIRVAGITGRIRGMKFTRHDGKSVRPDLCVPDDPQTDDSAVSASQTNYREGILTKAIRGLAGPGKKISILMPCTVIVKNDLADRVFDRRRHPDWDGVRLKALYSFPTNMKLWEEYARLYRESRERGASGSEATAFYKKNRAAMDAGCKIAWDARYEPGEISGIQYCMNLFLFSRSVFFSEHQNEPEEEILHSGRITAEAVLGKLNGRKRGEVPKDCQWLVAHVDVHNEILYWMVLAIEPGYRCYTIDYGTWPGQHVRYFQQSDPPQKLSVAYPRQSTDGVIAAGLQELALKHLLPRRYPREGGGDVPIDLVACDAGYRPETVATVIRATAQGSRFWPTKGVPFGPAKKPFTEYKPEKGVILGRHWRRCVTRVVSMLTLEMDVNRWKSFTRDRVMTALGDGASWSLFGQDPREHQLLADQLAAQYPTEVSGPWGKMEQWAVPPAKPDDHWFDNLVDALCAASALPAGPKLAEWERKKKPASGDKPTKRSQRVAVAAL